MISIIMIVTIQYRKKIKNSNNIYRASFSWLGVVGCMKTLSICVYTVYSLCVYGTCTVLIQIIRNCKYVFIKRHTYKYELTIYLTPTLFENLTKDPILPIYLPLNLFGKTLTTLSTILVLHHFSLLSLLFLFFI
jgi:hypothetical protein